MNLEKYPLRASDHHRVFAFDSEGFGRVIKKLILFQPLNIAGETVFNLSFGDWNEEKQQVDDTVISNNGDREKVLATVAAAVLEFMRQFPEAIIYAKGSTPSRTRLYQMNIASNLAGINRMFHVFGLKRGIWEDFRTARNYEAFILMAR
jgi:hypothetical protein